MFSAGPFEDGNQLAPSLAILGNEAENNEILFRGPVALLLLVVKVV